MELKVIWSPEDIKPGFWLMAGRRPFRKAYLVTQRFEAEHDYPVYGIKAMGSSAMGCEGTLEDLARVLSDRGNVLPCGSPLEDFLP